LIVQFQVVGDEMREGFDMIPRMVVVVVAGEKNNPTAPTKHKLIHPNPTQGLLGNVWTMTSSSRFPFRSFPPTTTSPTLGLSFHSNGIALGNPISAWMSTKRIGWKMKKRCSSKGTWLILKRIDCGGYDQAEREMIHWL